jgi:hypothetical protein
MTTLPSSSASLSVLLAIAEGGLYVRYRYVGIDVTQVVNNTKEKAKKNVPLSSQFMLMIGTVQVLGTELKLLMFFA